MTNKTIFLSKFFAVFAFVMMLALAGCEKKNPTDKLPETPPAKATEAVVTGNNDVSATPEPTVTQTVTATAVPTATPVPTASPTPSLRATLLKNAEKTAQNAIYALPLEVKYEEMMNYSFFKLGDNILVIEEDYESGLEVYLIDPSNGKRGRGFALDVNSLAYEFPVFAVIDSKYLIEVHTSEGKCVIYDQNLEKVSAFPYAGDYYSGMCIDDTNNMCYYCAGETGYACNYLTGDTYVLFIMSQHSSFECRKCFNGRYLIVSGYDNANDDYRKRFFVYDIQENVLTEDLEGDFNIEFSPDGKECVVATDKNIRFFRTSDRQPLSEIEYISSDETYSFEVDWDDRVLLTKCTMYGNTKTLSEMHVYSIDTGKLLADSVIRSDYAYLSPMIYTDENVSIVLGEAEEDTFSFYLWDYLKDGVEDKSDYYGRQNNVTETFSGRLDKLKAELEKKYGIFIYVGYEIAPVDFDYKLTVCRDEEKMYNTLLVVDKVFSSYPDGFFEQFKIAGQRTLGVYLCDGFTKTSDYHVENAIAIATAIGYERSIAIDVNYSEELEGTIYHEVSHWIDSRINNMGYRGICEDFDEKWLALNPKGYAYTENYADYYGNYKYTLAFMSDGESYDNVYFVDAYSQTYPTEDRARLFENVMVFDEYLECWKAVHLIEKLEYYFASIRRAFDSSDWPEKTVWEIRLDEWKSMYEAAN